jgi:hypothetical protein
MAQENQTVGDSELGVEEWRNLHDEELQLYFSPISIRVINKTEWNETWRTCGTYTVHTAFWWWRT